jgi:hypothetical protein
LIVAAVLLTGVPHPKRMNIDQSDQSPAKWALEERHG